MFYKKTVTFLKNFAIFTGKYLRWSLFFIKLQTFTFATLLKVGSNISVYLLQNFCERPILKNICVRQLVNWLYEVIIWNFVSGQSLSKPSWLIILQKYQSLWSLSFKHNLAHMPSLDLIPTLSGKPRFRMFIINGYYCTESKRFYSLDSLFVIEQIF